MVKHDLFGIAACLHLRISRAILESKCLLFMQKYGQYGREMLDYEFGLIVAHLVCVCKLNLDRENVYTLFICGIFYHLWHISCLNLIYLRLTIL